ncbi:MAG TPA: hypothetical protein VF266_25605, partial [Thermoanaerobaculia bacterium]
MTIAALVAWRVVVCSDLPRVEVAVVATGDRDYPYAAQATSCECDRLLRMACAELMLRLRPGAAPNLSATTVNGTTVTIRAGVLADARTGWYDVEVVRQGRLLSHTRRTVDLSRPHSFRQRTRERPGASGGPTRSAALVMHVR